jgi:predicted dehydrogenase
MVKRMNRRQFLESSGKAALGVGLGAVVADALATPTYAQAAKTYRWNTVRVGMIGTGGMGMGNLHGFMGHDDVKVVAVCDVDENRLNNAVGAVDGKYGRKPMAVKDYRQILDRRDIDAVVISTPDHWHALPFINACEVGKDVFVEKPISHDIVEGQAMVAAAKHFQRVSQVNTWQRSVGFYRNVIDFVRSGKMGKVPICRAWVCGGAGVGKQKPQTPPKELDWDFWLGPAPWTEYRPNRCHGSFRWFFDYAAGMSGDWGVHMIDIALLAMNAWHPLEVSSYGGKLISGEDDDRDTPDTQITIYKFPNFVLQWEVHVGGEGLDGGGGHGTEFIGENGRLIVDRGGINWKPYGDHPGPEEAGKDQGPDQPSRWANSDHIQDFLDNIRSRGKCRSDIETMHWTTTACHLANLSYLIGRSVKWDGEKGQVVGDKKAMECQSYRRQYRKPWTLPMHKA